MSRFRGGVLRNANAALRDHPSELYINRIFRVCIDWPILPRASITAIQAGRILVGILFKKYAVIKIALINKPQKIQVLPSA